ncbi:NUDIX domain-containing protein [Kribbella sp. NBC_01505]|uniref:NUDIX domain-containing protein n=1 Tax=Kribbella sp. NBC_01505 TaxID=2903580 RepID=UPI003864EE60
MVARIPISVALLVRDGLVLLVHRHPARRWYPDSWSFSAGGHVEAGELPHEAVVRECFEELGVRVHDAVRVPMTISDPTLDVQAFLVTRWDGEPVNAAPEEHDDLRWFRPGELAGLKLAHPESLPNLLDAINRGYLTPPVI